ncbi:MAG: penicillin-insensitive murein endopeptidase, partial [Succinatimonas hippei]|nr:penicillin-insensitive murein endopeptidase [Succinatimonas hippei]
TGNFTNARATLIYLAANDSRVQRIFVAPGIKRALCRMYERDGYSTAWLHKIRPWYGHRGHMHVRLFCPKDSPYCKAQAEAPEGDGCGAELDSWFLPPKPVKPGTKPKPKPSKVLPEQCAAVLRGQ